MTALTWGDWSITGGNGMRVGLQARDGWGVDTNSTQWAFTFDVWTGNQFRYSDQQTLNFGGDAARDPVGFNNTQGAGTSTLRHSGSIVYNYPADSFGVSPGNLVVVSSVSGTYNGSTPTHTIWVPIPARPFATPSAPTNVVAIRNSDTQVTISGTHPTSAQRPVQSMTIQMREFSGSSWGGWETIFTGAGTTFVRTGLSANRIYEFQMRLNNSAGSSAFVPSASAVHMTPAAPSAATAAITGSGSAITVGWTSNAFTSSAVTHSLERRAAENGDAWTAVPGASAIPQAVTVFTDTAPIAGASQYRVRSTTSVGTLSSEWALTNIVSTIVPPLAPNGLAPNGTAMDLAAGTTLSWVHRHGGDGAPQSAYRIRYSTDSGGTWTLLADGVVSTVSSHVVAPEVLPNGPTYLWQVQTRGVESVGFGPYSVSAVVQAAGAPVITLTSPPAVLNNPPMHVAWDYTQPQGHPQAGWEAELRDADGAFAIEAQAQDSAVQSAVFDFPVVDGTAYTVRARARSTDGMWSPWASRGVAVDIPPPAGVLLSGGYNRCTGQVALQVFPIAPVPGVTQVPERVEVFRSINGSPWVPIVRLRGGERVTIKDMVPSTTGRNVYRAISYASDGMTDISAPATIQGSDGFRSSGLWAFLSYGPDFGTSVRFRGDPSISATTVRERDASQMQDRRFPFPLLGRQVRTSISVSGAIHNPDGRCIVLDDDCTSDSHRDQWEAASHESGIVCYRDWTGRRVFGLMGSLTVSPRKGSIAVYDISFSIEQTDWDEQAVAPSSPPAAPPRALVLR